MTCSPRILPISFAVVFASFISARAATVDFEDLSLPGPDTYYNGDPPGVQTSPFLVNGSFVSRGSTFANQFEIQNFGGFDFPFWNGFAYSNVTNNVTAGFGNQYSAITGTGYNSPNYGIGFDSGPFFLAPIVTLPTAEYPVSVRVTNATYAYRAIVDGNDGGANFSRQFGDDPNTPGIHGNEGFSDLLTLTITGRDSLNNITGTVDVTMADYTFADNADDYALADWLAVDLSALGTNTRMLQFSMTSTDSSSFGANTPLYFALDDLVTAVDIAQLPEPSSWLSAGLVALMFGGGAHFVRRRQAALGKK